MERITYRKTLDVHKNGTQFLLQGFQTADNMSRVIEISLMASGDSIDFPLERLVAVMYVTSPGAKEPSINKCTIEDNKVVYEVLPITTEGITKMQLKLIESSPEGAKSVLVSPEFAVEVTKSDAIDTGEEVKKTFTAIEEFIAKADVAYGSRLKRIELSSDCVFRVFYADGTIYETDVIRRLVLQETTDLDLDALIRNGIAKFTAEEVAEKLDEKYSRVFGEAVETTDLFADYPHPSFVKWDENTKNTPYKAEKTAITQGFALVHGTISGEHTVITWTMGGEESTCYTHYHYNGIASEWKCMLLDSEYFFRRTGDTLTGVLKFEDGLGEVFANNDKIYMKTQSNEENSRGIEILNPSKSDVEFSELLQFFDIKDGKKKSYNIYGEHNSQECGLAFIETGEYVGNGDYGIENPPTVIPYKKTPKLIIIQPKNDGSVMLLSYGVTWSRQLGMSSENIHSNQRVECTWNENQVSFRVSASVESAYGDAGDQMNDDGRVYLYTIFY